MSDRQRLLLALSILVLSTVTAFAASTAEVGAPRSDAVAETAAGADGGARDPAGPEDELDALGDEENAPAKVPSRVNAPPIATAKPLPARADLITQAWLDANGRLAVGPKQSPRVLTIDAPVQKKLTEILKSYETPYGAVVLMEPKSGRVLAMAEHSHAAPWMRGLPVKAIFPAASIFKIVTASALLEEGIQPEDTECSRLAKRRILEKNLEDSDEDRLCFSLSHALALSQNGVFAKMTIKHLTAKKLLEWAERFRFNKPMQFEMPADVSLAAVPESPLALAQTGAGFGDVYLSPLHGAAIASAVANRGLWRAPVLIEGDPQPEPVRVMSAENAEKLVGMMEETVTLGTARRIFRQRGFRVPGAVGKTGSLADKKPFRDYSWFVGFAPKEDPQVAVAAVIVNDAYWRIRATWLGREAMRIYLESRQKANGRDVARAEGHP